MSGQRLSRGALLVAAIGLLACDQPPSREIGAAEAALAQARKDGADAYAPERFKEADAALDSARRKVEEKDYRGALSSAMDAGEKARNASQAAAAAKLLAKSSAEVAQAEAQASLDEVAAVREEAARSKVPDEAFADLEPRLEEARQALASIDASLEQGALLEAQKSAADLKARLAPLPEEARAAVASWQEAHPKGRRPAKAPGKKKS